MAPVRRYLRITKYSVLECRIYLDNPGLAHSWLLNPRDPVLPKVIESVRPLVLPKLREERERARKKSTKKRGIKDVIVADDFEVSIFLTETSTRHSLLYKNKHFRDTTQTKLTSNSSRLTGATREVPIDIDGQEQEDADVPVQIRQEDSDDDAPIVLDDIPTVGRVEPTGRPKRRRRETASANQDGSEHDSGDISDDGDGLFVTDDEHSSDDGRQPPSKRLREGAADDEEQQDDKKKMAMDISYEGFSIYGRVLCLVVKKRETTSSKSSSAATSSKTTQRGVPGGQAMMENWITSTQLPEAGIPDELEAP